MNITLPESTSQKTTRADFAKQRFNIVPIQKVHINPIYMDSPSVKVYDSEELNLLVDQLNQNVADDVISIEAETGDDSDNIGSFWKAQNHFIVFSSSGKPIYTFHGSEEAASGITGFLTGVVASFLLNKEEIKRVTVKGTLVVFVNKDPITLVSISRDFGLNAYSLKLQQLHVLYGYLLTTLSESNLRKLYLKNSSFDLRRLLSSTDYNNLDKMVSGFVNKENLSSTIGGLATLYLDERIRIKISKILVGNSTVNLLYGLVLSQRGELIDVLRPRTHTLHTQDLQVIFQILVNKDAESIDKLWVPLCLPKFNSQGFLYAYVTTVEVSGEKILLILLSAFKDSFFEMDRIASGVVSNMIHSNTICRKLGSFVRCEVKVPAFPLIQHFIFKSKSNLQYFHPPIDSATLYHYYSALIQYRHYQQQQVSYVKWKIDAVNIKIGVSINSSKYELYALTNNCNYVNNKILMRSCRSLIKWCLSNDANLFINQGAVF